MSEALLLLAMFAAGALLCPVLATVVVVVAMRTMSRVYFEAMGHMREVANSALISRGLNPHVVDPATYGPTGMSRADEQSQAAKVAAAQEAAFSEEEESLRSAEEAYMAHLAKMAVNSSASGNGN